MGMNFEK